MGNNYGKRRPISQNRRRPTKRRPHPNSKKNVERKLNKKKVFITALIFILIIYLIVKPKEEETVETSEQNGITTYQEQEIPDIPVTPINEHDEEVPPTKREITEWNLRLANYENLLPEDFEVELADIDDTRQFDARAIK